VNYCSRREEEASIPLMNVFYISLLFSCYFTVYCVCNVARGCASSISMTSISYWLSTDRTTCFGSQWKHRDRGALFPRIRGEYRIRARWFLRSVDRNGFCWCRERFDLFQHHSRDSTRAKSSHPIAPTDLDRISRRYSSLIVAMRKRCGS
jgi:hypothetical protein